MNGDYTERLSQEGECREAKDSSILESASAVARGILESIEALAGTTACKSVQLQFIAKTFKLQSHLTFQLLVYFPVFAMRSLLKSFVIQRLFFPNKSEWVPVLVIRRINSLSF